MTSPAASAASTDPAIAGEVVTVAPAAPTEVNAELIAPRAVRVTWNDVSGEAGYHVERRIDGTTEPWTRVGSVGAGDVSFTQDGLSAGRTYLYRVRAFNEAGVSEPSNVDFVTVAGEPTELAAPRLEGRLVEPRAVRLAWTNVANETGYRIERRVDGTDGPFVQIATTGRDITIYTDDGLESGRTYIYRVRAFNQTATSAYSNTLAVRVAVPSAPRELNAELIRPNAARVSWRDVSGETGYRVERRLGGTDDWVQIRTVGANVTSIVDEQLLPDRTYVYRVRAFNAAGNSAYSNTDSVTTPEASAPSAPRELTAAVAEEGRAVRLRWLDVASETGYRIERRIDGTTTWRQVGQTGANVTSFLDTTDLVRGTTYIYRVRAVNGAGASPWSNTAAVALPREGTQAPAAPRATATVVGQRTVRVTWTNVANETGYRVERRLDGTSTWTAIRTVGANVTAITDEGLSPGRTYIYRVRAFNAAGNSAWSNTVAATLPREGFPSAPRELRATAVSPTRVNLRWIDASGETGYHVERRLDGTSTWSRIGTAARNATTFSDTTARPGRTYIYRVRAFNTVGTSTWSNTAAARTPGETPEAPAAPRLEGALAAPRAVRLAWTNVSGETGYRVERRVGDSAEWRLVRTTEANVTTTTQDGLSAGTTFHYRVRAFNGAGSSAWSNTVSITTPREEEPEPQPAVEFATYLGGSTDDSARDVVTDAQGNVYVTGGTTSANFPTTAGAFDRTYNGVHDIYVTKIDPQGRLVWSTFLGGPAYDRAYAIELAPDGSGIFVAGRGGPGAPTTAGAFQPQYRGLRQPNFYGEQNAFIAKLRPDGSGVIWASYFGPYELIRDIAVDDDGDVYVAGTSHALETNGAPAEWFEDARQRTRRGESDAVIAKVRGDGSRVEWASYLGGSGRDGGAPSIRVDSQERPVVVFTTHSADAPTTSGAFDRTLGGTNDLLVAKFDDDGSELLFSTYLGGGAGEGTETHNLAMDRAGNVYVGAVSNSPDYPTTAGAYDRTFNGLGGSGTGGGTNYPGDAVVTKLSPAGTVLASTFVGGSAGDAAEGIAVDGSGNVYLTGATFSANFPTTTRVAHRGRADVFAAKLSSDLSRLEFATLVGGSGTEAGRAAHYGPGGDFFVAGVTDSLDLPDRDALQGRLGGGSDALMIKLRDLGS